MRVVSFFAGCGGLDLGFEQAGFQVVWANEFDSAVRNTYLKNHPRTEFVLDDIVRISPDAIPDSDGFIGGPPCQSWSVAGKQRGLDDMRGKLFLTYIDLIKVKKPKFYSHGDRYLGMTAAMTQAPVPTAMVPGDAAWAAAMLEKIRMFNKIH